MAAETGLSRGQYKSVAPSPHKKSGCSPLCPACGDNCNNVPLQTEVKTRVVDNTDLRREVFKRLGHFRLDKNAANESIETADCRNEGYELEHTIGKGAYSVVKRARIKATKMQRSSKLSEHVTKCGHNKVRLLSRNRKQCKKKNTNHHILTSYLNVRCTIFKLSTSVCYLKSHFVKRIKCI